MSYGGTNVAALIDFPKHNINPDDKGVEWHMQYCQAAYQIYVRDQTTIPYSRKGEIRLNRLYSIGNQPTSKYRDRLSPGEERGGEGRKGYMNLSHDILAIAPKFVELIIGQFESVESDISFDAIDEKSLNEKELKKWMMWAETKLKPFHDKTGYQEENSLVKEHLPTYPDSEGELDMFLEAGSFKLQEEIAMEAAVDYSMYLSRWPDIKRKLLRDLIENGVAAAKDYVDPATQQPKTRYVDIENYISSYQKDQTSDSTSFAGEIRYITVAKLRELAGDNLTEDQYENLAEEAYKNSDIYNDLGFNYYRNKNGGAYGYDQLLVPVVDIEWFSYDIEKYTLTKNSKGGETFNKKKFGYSKRSSEKKKVEQSMLRTVHKGSWVVGTDYLYDWGYQNDVPKPDKTEARLSYHYFEVSKKSMISNMIPLLDDIQLAWMKLQNALVMAAPPGIAVNVDAIRNIKLGIKGGTSPLQIQEIRRATGTLYYSSVNPQQKPGDSPQSGLPITELQGGIGSFLNESLAKIESDLQLIREITGLSQPVSSPTPEARTSVAATEISVGSTNNVLNNLYVAYKWIKEETAKNLSLRWQIVARYKEFKISLPALGRNTMEVIKIGSNISFAQMGIKIQDRPSELEVENLLRRVAESNARSTQGGTGISASDMISIERRIKAGQIKLAQVSLAYKEEEAIKRAEEQQMAAIKQQGEEQRALQQQGAQIAAEAAQREIQEKIAVETSKSANRRQEEDNKSSNREQQNTQLGSIKSGQQSQKDEADLQSQHSKQDSDERQGVMKAVLT